MPPHRDLLNWDDFDWGRFSVVRFGPTVPSPDSNLMTSDVYRATGMALLALRHTEDDCFLDRVSACAGIPR